MADMDDDMTADEFDQRLKAGQPVELQVAIASPRQPLYTLAVVTVGGAVAALGSNVSASVRQVQGEIVPAS
jgi:hypothetical protein